jgi:DNA-binding NtrC family response regulator
MKRILVADRDEGICLLYSLELTEQGYEVVTTRDSAKFMTIVEQLKPDLVVLEAEMGKYNSRDLLQEMRKSHYEMPVILSTTYTSRKRKPRAIAIEHFVEKSWNLYELKMKVKMALEGRTPSLSHPTPSSLNSMGKTLTKQTKFCWT